MQNLVCKKRLCNKFENQVRVTEMIGFEALQSFQTACAHSTVYIRSDSRVHLASYQASFSVLTASA